VKDLNSTLRVNSAKDLFLGELQILHFVQNDSA